MVLLSAVGCHKAVRPPSSLSPRAYCTDAAQTADMRALRGNALGFVALAGAGATAAGVPIVGSAVDDDRRRTAIQTAMIGSAVITALVARRVLSGARHERAIAGAFSDCIATRDRRTSFVVALSTYRLWIDHDVRPGTLIRIINRLEREAQAPRGWAPGPPPSGPPEADSGPPEPPSRPDILEAKFEHLNRLPAI